MLELSDWFLFWLFDSFVLNGLLLHPGGMWCSIRPQSCAALRGKLLMCSVIGGLSYVLPLCALCSAWRMQMHLPMGDVSQLRLLGRGEWQQCHLQRAVSEGGSLFLLRQNNLNGNWLPCILTWKQRRCILGPRTTHWRVRHFVGYTMEELAVFSPIFSQSLQQHENHWGCRNELTWPFVTKAFCLWCPLSKIWHTLLVLSTEEFMGRHPHLWKKEQNNQTSGLPFMPCGENAFGYFQLLLSAGSMAMTDRVLLEHILPSKHWLWRENKETGFWVCFCPWLCCFWWMSWESCLC